MGNQYETTITHYTDGYDSDEYVWIETSEKTVLTALEAKPDRFEKVSETKTRGLPRLCLFRIPVSDVNWGSLARRKGAPRPNLQKDAARAS